MKHEECAELIRCEQGHERAVQNSIFSCESLSDCVCFCEPFNLYSGAGLLVNVCVVGEVGYLLWVTLEWVFAYCYTMVYGSIIY